MTPGWLDKLNPAQQEAVTHGDGPLLVVAGAGTGKTRTLACRVAYLIEQGVAPQRILLLTFTRRAAADMLRRADELITGSAGGKVWGGTFHATGNRLLRIYGEAIGLAPDFTVVDQGDAADLLHLIRSDLGLATRDRRFPRKATLLAIYSRTVNAQEKLTDVLARHFPWCRDHVEEIKRIFEDYMARKREQHLLDFDDLLLTWSALCSAPGVGSSVADRFEHVLVDEYQDTNAIQSEIIRGLRRQRPNVMAVGDDAQSIYSFRAATMRNILDFPKDFPGTRIVTLEQNYRSTQPIIAASNAVMEEASERYTKRLWSERRSDQKPVLFTCLDEAEQCTVTCDHVLAHLEQGTPLARQAVLFRASHHSDQLEVELARRRIPFHKYGGLRFVEAAHIKDMLAFLRILENPYDELSWFRVLQLIDGIGPKTAHRLMEGLGVRRLRAVPRARSVRVSDEPEFTSPLKRLLEEPPIVPAAAREVFGELRAALADCGPTSAPGDSAASKPSPKVEPPLAAQLERIRRFYEPLFAGRYDNATVRLRDIEQLEHLASRYGSRRRLVTDMTLDPPRSTSDFAGPPSLDEDYLVLSTIHSAKGCEWDVVHIIHAADGMIPSDMAVSDAAGVDEERRLLYVAMTRAKDRLYVYFPLRYYHRRQPTGDAHSFAQLTRFIPRSVRECFEDRCGRAAEDRDAGATAETSGLRALDQRLKKLWGD